MNPQTLLAGAVETACNSALALDPEVRARLGALAGKVIAVEVEGLGIRLFFFPHAQGVEVLGNYEGEPDTLLRGAPLSLARLAVSRRPADEMFGGGVELRGDTATGQAFQEILQSLDIDWEELLARVAGDDLAHQAGRLASGAGEQARRAGQTLEADLSEYLHEESRLLVDHASLRTFLGDVDDLRSDTDRLEARLRRLESAPAKHKD